MGAPGPESARSTPAPAQARAVPSRARDTLIDFIGSGTSRFALRLDRGAQAQRRVATNAQGARVTTVSRNAKIRKTRCSGSGTGEIQIWRARKTEKQRHDAELGMLTRHERVSARTGSEIVRGYDVGIANMYGVARLLLEFKKPRGAPRIGPLSMNVRGYQVVHAKAIVMRRMPQWKHCTG